jgi:hypothetical protein
VFPIQSGIAFGLDESVRFFAAGHDRVVTRVAVGLDDGKDSDSLFFAVRLCKPAWGEGAKVRVVSRWLKAQIERLMLYKGTLCGEEEENVADEGHELDTMYDEYLFDDDEVPSFLFPGDFAAYDSGEGSAGN